MNSSKKGESSIYDTCLRLQARTRLCLPGGIVLPNETRLLSTVLVLDWRMAYFLWHETVSDLCNSDIQLVI